MILPRDRARCGSSTWATPTPSTTPSRPCARRSRTRKARRKHPSTITQDGEPDAEKALLKPLQDLSKLVLEPLAEHIDGKKRWYVSPDASLWLVPWAALPLKDGRYAVEAHTISYLVSGRDLVAAAVGQPRRAGRA